MAIAKTDDVLAVPAALTAVKTVIEQQLKALPSDDGREHDLVKGARGTLTSALSLIVAELHAHE